MAVISYCLVMIATLLRNSFSYNLFIKELHLNTKQSDFRPLDVKDKIKWYKSTLVFGVKSMEKKFKLTRLQRRNFSMKECTNLKHYLEYTDGKIRDQSLKSNAKWFVIICFSRYSL